MYQKISIIGRLGQEPKMQYFPDGTASTTLNVAVDDTYNEGGTWKKKTVWYKVSIRGKKAEIANQFLHKGSRVQAEGKIRTNNEGKLAIWLDRNQMPNASLEIITYDFTFIDSKAEGDQLQSGTSSTPQSAPQDIAVEEDDMPF